MAEMTGLGGEDWNEELAPSGMTSYLLNKLVYRSPKIAGTTSSFC